ncbi:RNA polymerase sigma-70 factor, ECF subfamily [Streptoalloteichus tenebrarius]|uniref:RNA polymerase sigma-70 factor, ECF subfamily n=1 Tax=Streptoalloteichus tenebrarius (strain ATCC 17920 / DSM 40477 / JCM 4838 / CBS 697.72 / NBRC 16177 / NCIMB 11028 / NRRL B-12390 / A12253. 1 / ISP 5477) TaxID=1933 RepID=A0ABT1I073_STRSD|nr:sigma-70 family RNA polymerase sigma factor [Streptoalloteichus tenebrarius]MCP2261146.1 RNA polymerase sigma-70 factor, ECF subfamily [Streptoalloteichus tenebrarius]BFF03943.1 hypothetical protein GCM10020241_56180 [Streptoalloteichus tenebrarius]
MSPPQDRFDALYRQHYDPIARYLGRRLQPHVVEDAVAEVFTVAWRRRDHLPHDREVLPWLYEVARRVAANERRRQDRYTQLAQRLAVHSDRSTTGLEPEQLDVAAAFDHLTAEDQELLLLSAWDGLSVGQIAALLGCGRSAAAMRLLRARRRLAAALRPVPPLSARRQPKGVL